MKKPDTIRQAKQTDRQRLKEIIDISFPKFFRFFANHSIDSKNGIVLVSEKEGVVAGFAKLTQFTMPKAILAASFGFLSILTSAVKASPLRW